MFRSWRTDHPRDHRADSFRARTFRSFFFHGAAALVVLAGLTFGAPLGATTLEPMTGEELTSNADRVVVAQCTEAQTRWHGRALVTELTFAVGETLEGEATDELVVAIPGGVDPERGVAITFPGAPNIVPGEDFLLFLHQLEGTDMLGVVGLSQGAFPIIYQEGKAMVSQSRANGEGSLELDQVKRRIRSYLQNRNARTGNAQTGNAQR